VGWAALERLVNDFKASVDVLGPADLRALLAVPFMTQKVARALADRGVGSPELLVDSDPAALAQTLLLAMGFQLQVINGMLRVGTLSCWFVYLLSFN
jgi:hypothetical protein